MQPAVWDQWLQWIDGQWGVVGGLGQLETLLDELRYGAGAGLVKLRLWQWRQQQFGTTVGWWRQQHLIDLEATDEAVGAATVWINIWVVEAAAAATTTAATAAAAATATAE